MGNKVDYWVDEEYFNSQTYSAYLSGSSISDWNGTNVIIGLSESKGKKSKPERLTFIAPKSSYVKSSFALFGDKDVLLPITSDTMLIESKLKKGKKIKIYVAEFTKENSPLVFRNFLTISTSEKFESESYIDN